MKKYMLLISIVLCFVLNANADFEFMSDMHNRFGGCMDKEQFKAFSAPYLAKAQRELKSFEYAMTHSKNDDAENYLIELTHLIHAAYKNIVHPNAKNKYNFEGHKKWLLDCINECKEKNLSADIDADLECNKTCQLFQDMAQDYYQSLTFGQRCFSYACVMAGPSLFI